MNAPVDPGRVVPLELVERRPRPVDLLVRARRVVLPDGERAAAVAVLDGLVCEVGPVDVVLPARDEVVLDDDEVLLPGLVDTHVHLHEPGVDAAEGFAAATRAAAAGGITTLVDIPAAGPDDADDGDVAAWLRRRERAEGVCFADVGFRASVTPETTDEDAARLRAAGAVGFAVHLGDPASAATPQRLRALAALAHGDGAPLVVHASPPPPAAPPVSVAPPASEAGPDTATGYLAHLRRLDAASEYPGADQFRLVDVAIDVARDLGVPVHIAPLSVAAAVERVARARAAGLPVSAETCPHYLTLAAETIPDDVAAAHLAWPPVRESLQREGLWQALRYGSLGMVVTDHTPVADADKRPADGDLARVVPGLSSLQLSLPLVWTGAVARGFALADVVAWMSQAPARAAGLDDRKGAIVVGRDADLVAFAPDEEASVVPARLWHRQKASPYAGSLLRGVVRRTWLRGVPVSLTHPRGRLLAPTP